MATLINNRAPALTSDLFLSHLVAAHVDNDTIATQPPISDPLSDGIPNDCAPLSFTLFPMLSCFLAVIAGLL